MFRSYQALSRSARCSVQAWNDQQVVVYDCMSRLWTYRYVGVFDKDEFIVPKLQNPIQGALKSLLVRHR